MARQFPHLWVRRPGAAVAAVFVTLGLFYVMQALSAVHAVRPPEPPPPIEFGFAEVLPDSEPERKDRLPVRPVTGTRRPIVLHTGGSVRVSIDVNAAGGIDTVRVYSSDPPGVFDRAALRAASGCRFLARTVAGEPVAARNVPPVFRFDPTLQEETR